MKESETPSSASFFFFHLGCPKNLVDAERVAGLLMSRGWIESSDPSQAGLLVVTTCAFISIAEEESVNEILRVAAGKEEWQKLAVVGCLVTREGDRLKELFPEVDIFLSVSEFERLPSVAEAAFPRFRDSILACGEEVPVRRRLYTPAHMAYLKIAEGCSNHCSYCTIPGIRGELASRSGDEIMEDAKDLAGRGVKELVVIAQDTSSYGRDLDGKEDLYSLLERVSSLDGIEWVRLMYLHPAHIDPEEIVRLIDKGTVIPYLDIPVQHVSDRILQAMGRGYTGQELGILFDKIRSCSRDVVLRTTLMVGFPGETDEEFTELVTFLEKYRLDHVGAFAYSPERGTPAARSGGKVDSSIVTARMDEITAVQMDISHDRLLAMTGTEIRVLVDEKTDQSEAPVPGVWGTGRFYGQAYEIDGLTYLSGKEARPGSLIAAKVIEAEAFDLFADTDEI